MGPPRRKKVKCQQPKALMGHDGGDVVNCYVDHARLTHFLLQLAEPSDSEKDTCDPFNSVQLCEFAAGLFHRGASSIPEADSDETDKP